MELSKIFGLIASQMKEELALIKQQPKELRGRAREVIIHRFLKPFLPKSLGIGSGVIISASGENSGEIDVIIYDKSTYNLFKPFTSYMPETTRPFPAEVVYGIIEVEHKLTRDGLCKCVEKIGRAKKLPKVAYFEQSGVHRFTNMYGKKWDYFPTFGIVFAFDSENLKELTDTLEQLYKDKNLSIEQQANIICVLNKGLIAYYDYDKDLLKFAPEPEPKYQLTCGGIEPEECLSLLFRLVMQVLSQVFIRPIKVSDYFGERFQWKPYYQKGYWVINQKSK